MVCQSSRPCWLARTARLPATAAVGILLAACASLHNTPAQDLAWSRWAVCRAQISGADIRAVQLDGRISFWCDGVGDGFAMRDCLRQAAKDGPVLPEPLFEVRPKGGS
jgi:hypothetical protein